jgi:hypothetical protein
LAGPAFRQAPLTLRHQIDAALSAQQIEIKEQQGSLPAKIYRQSLTEVKKLTQKSFGKKGLPLFLRIG